MLSDGRTCQIWGLGDVETTQMQKTEQNLGMSQTREQVGELGVMPCWQQAIRWKFRVQTGHMGVSEGNPNHSDQSLD